ncbi:MAG: DUF4304 domain-containing protein, partial [Gammaproteobacteria bacterium]|nr:DUF4304 domain-containing protein [Gammaproteobacteria bacterium]
NLGVYHPSWVQATATIPRMEFVGPVTDRPAEQYCFLRERLDELAFAEADADEWDSNWWQVSRHVSVAELGESVMSAFENHALPWFDKYSKLEDAVAYLDREYIGKNNAWLEKISAMCGQALLGNLDRAGALYAAALKESVNRNEMQKEFADWRKAHGIVAPA